MPALLERHDLTLSDITRLVSDLERSSPPRGTTTFGLSGNVTIDLLGTFLRKRAVMQGYRAEVQAGTFGDHIGNVRRFAADGVDAIIVLDLFDAILPAFEARIEGLGPDQVLAQVDRYRSELAIVLAEARGVKDVFIGGMHRLTRPGATVPDAVDRAIAVFNDAIADVAGQFANVHVISTASITSGLGSAAAHNVRSYERFRAPFAPAFLDEFAGEIYFATRGFGAYFYKALVLDCDGTLWGGVLGEDQLSGIQLGPFGYPGSMYWRLQHEFLALQRHGVLLCLNSKNNAADVDAVLSSHPDMVLRDEHIVAKRVNWDDKVANLESLASDLSIGLDSMVFVDDSPFECEAVRGRLPMVKTLLVPTDLSEYPDLARDLRRLFAVGSESGEGATKTEQYRSRMLASDERRRFETQQEYLESLGLKVTIRRNEAGSAQRIAELTQKSNQFNLTTHRYTTGEIVALMDASESDVFSIHVADKFGDAGLTGVAITRREEPDSIRVDSFLVSCRILGRGIEAPIWAALLEDARDAGRTFVVAEYLPTAKNTQVVDFWGQVGLDLVGESVDGRREYRSDLRSLSLAPPPSHMEVDRDF